MKGTAIPVGPGLSQGSPSRVTPWTAIAASAVTAVCSWIAVSTRGSPGLRAQRPAIVSPRPTEIVTSARATIPEARLASHHAVLGQARCSRRRPQSPDELARDRDLEAPA